MPPNFEQDSRAPEIIDRNERYKPRRRIFALDGAHARVAPYAYHLRVFLANPDDLTNSELMCHVAQCKPRPIRISRVDARPMRFFPRVTSTMSNAGSRRWTGRTPSRSRAIYVAAYSTLTIYCLPSRHPSVKSFATVLRQANCCVCSPLPPGRAKRAKPRAIGSRMGDQIIPTASHSGSRRDASLATA